MKAKHLMYKLLFILIIINSLNGQLIKSNKSLKEITNADRGKLTISNNVSRILNKLLYGYDKRVRPNYAGPPVQVGITMSEVDMDYSMDIFFRQYWVDKRLAFEGINELVIGSDVLKQIWVPDTFIANDKKVYFHAATVQNKFIRIYPDGQIVYSMRFTVTAACPMNFKYFPMDHQICSFEVESYGFRMDDIKYKWGTNDNSSRKALDISPNIELPQFIYKDSKLIEREFHLSTGVYSRLTLKLYFVRSLGHYIIQIYIPSALIVILSWVSFWIDRASAPARVSLGITTVLTMLTLIWNTNAALPKISYIKGIDVYLVFCFIMTFFSVIEYGAVSFIHRYNERSKKKNASEQTAPVSPQSTNTNNGYSSFINQCQYRHPHPLIYANRAGDSTIDFQQTTNILPTSPISITSDRDIIPNNLQNHVSTSTTTINNKPRSLKLVRHFRHSDHCLTSSQFRIQQMENGIQTVTRISNNNTNVTSNVVNATTTLVDNRSKPFKIYMKASSIDNSSRVLFPVVFFVFNLIYWIYYMLIVYTVREFD